MRLGITMLFAVAITAAVNVHAQTYPSHPVKIVVPAAPGTASDGVARVIADGLAKDAGMKTVVENKVGANGIIGIENVARGPADGYTVLQSPSTLYINKIIRPKVNYEISDFKPVAKVASAYLVLVVPSNSPFHTLNDAVKYIKAHPNKINYSSGGTGSVTHLSFAILAGMAGIEALHVPYKGGGAALTDTVSGQVAMTFTAIATAKGNLAAGKLRALAVTGPKRSSTLPDVPTVAELGYKGYEAVSGLGFTVPKGVPDGIVNQLSKAILKAAQTDEFRKYAQAQGLEVDAMDASTYAADIQREMSTWEKAVKESGMQVQ